METEVDNFDPVPKTSSLKYQDDSNYVVKSWEERLEEYERLFAKSNAEQDVQYSRMADLKVLPPEIHEDILRALLFYYQRWAWDQKSQPKLFHVTLEMRREAVSKMFQDILYFSPYYTYLINSIHRLYVKEHFRYVYGKVEEEIKKFLPEFSLFGIFDDFRFSKFLHNIIVYPKNHADVEKIKGLIRLNQIETDHHVSSLFHEPVKYLDSGFAFKIGFPKSSPNDTEKILDILEPFEFELVQSTLPMHPTSSDKIFNRLQIDQLELFLGDIYWGKNHKQHYVTYDRTQKEFHRINFKTKEKRTVDFSVDLTITHPNVMIYTTHPEILTIHADYEVPVNAYDIASFTIDYEEYKLPEVPEEIKNDNLSKLIEKCKADRLNKYIDGK